MQYIIGAILGILISSLVWAKEMSKMLDDEFDDYMKLSVDYCNFIEKTKTDYQALNEKWAELCTNQNDRWAEFCKKIILRKES